ncbi:hypothetical protein [Chryseobacterium sp.]|uniref:hypothetical protein n=1 Tax=Chryseobacterium sp. TaxID=1871047 RepID=UPI002898A938|nr:hypothetical protein [Chryseobacterium sp.]
MEIKVSLDEYADVQFIKKLLFQLKGVVNVEVENEEKSYSWNEIENFESFAKVMEQSELDYKSGRHEELTDDLLDELFNKK